MSQLKANQKEKIKNFCIACPKVLSKELYRSTKVEEIIKMCESRYRKRQRNRDER